MVIKVLVFDFWNTIIGNSDEQYIKKIVDILGFPDQKSFWKFCDAHWFPTKMTMQEFFTYVCKLKKVDKSFVGELAENYNNALRTVKPFPDAVPTLDELRSKYNLVLLSNTALEEGNKALDDFNLRQYFYDILLSPEFGVAKPNLEFFQKVLDNSNVSPSEVCIVGDDIDNDIIPARRIGFRTILIDREGKYADHESPDIIIRSLNELKNVI